MKKEIFSQYHFDKFTLDSRSCSLYFEKKLVGNITKKSLQVLIALLKKPKQVVSHEEIIEQVWGDNYHGVNANNLAQYILKLRKILAQFQPEKTFIGTGTKRGYIFVEDVIVKDETVKVDDLQASDATGAKYYLPPPSLPTPNYAPPLNVASPVEKNYGLKLLIASLTLILIVVAVSVSRYYSASDEEEIKRVVEDSQKYESLTLYKNPASFTEEQLDKYWTAEPDVSSNADRNRIRQAVKKLADEGRSYGDATKCEQFEFQSIEINADKNFAVVRTLEKWFIATYFDDGTLQKNKYVGPYFVSYLVRKVDGRWLIEKSNTARVNRPTPRLSDIETDSEIKPGHQFFVRLTGQDFEAETVYIEIFGGGGCPVNKPCKISNMALRENSKLTETALENVPLTLDSGDFRFVVRNGDSPESNPVYLKVP